MLTSIERDGALYTARSATEIVWTREVRLDDHGLPFREEVIWPAAGVVAIAHEKVVKFLSAETGAIVRSIFLGHDLFGGFGPVDGDTLFVLGWTQALAVDATLSTRWRSGHIAVDGITWRERIGDRILLSCEMDPPGGWVDVELDARTGEQLR